MIDYNEKKLFFDEYLDGRKEYYYTTYGELLDTFGENWANEIWKRGYIPKDYYSFEEDTEKNYAFNQDDDILDYNNLDEIISSYLFDN